MYRQLLVVCLFLAIAADLLEAKSSLHKRNQDHHRSGRQGGGSPPIPAGFMELLQCKRNVETQAQQQCPVPALFTRVGQLPPMDQFPTLMATDLGEVCAAVNQAFGCALPIYTSDTNCQQAERLNPAFPAIRQFFQRTLNYVCVERLSVFNSSKVCLLGTTRSAPPPVAIRAMGLCPQDLMNFADRLDVDPASTFFGPESLGCIPPAIQTCARNASAAQCGEPSGEAINGLISIAREHFCVVPTATASAKRQWADDFILFGKMLQMF